MADDGGKLLFILATRKCDFAIASATGFMMSIREIDIEEEKESGRIEKREDERDSRTKIKKVPSRTLTRDYASDGEVF